MGLGYYRMAEKVSVSSRTLRRFIDSGGYALLESFGSGKTSDEKQMSGWERYGAIRELQKRTKTARPTLYKIKSAFPTAKSAGVPEGVVLRREDYESLRNACNRLEEAEGTLKWVKERLGRCFLVDATSIRSRQELLGESLEEAFKMELRKEEGKEGELENLMNDGLKGVNSALMVLRFILQRNM